MSKAQIMVVEDESITARYIQNTLEASGYEVPSVASSGEEAIELAESLRPDLILMDIVLKGEMNGIEAAEYIHDRLRIPVIYLTANSNDSILQQAKGSQPYGFLIKPIRERELYTTIEMALYKNKAEKALRESNQNLEQALSELEAAQLQIIQQERFHALEQMAGGIAHNVNNALTPAMGFSELLISNPDRLDDRLQTLDMLKSIYKGTKDAADIIGRLGEFARGRSGRETIKAFDLNGLIDQTISFTRSRWRDQALAQGISFDIKTSFQDIPLIEGNETELWEMLINLILNAVDASPSGGVILIRTHHDADQVVIEVIDSGIGMSEEVRSRCLDPFFTTKEEGGTGLGLSTVYGTVKRHNGDIDIESKPGRGTTFTIRLPAQKTPAQTEQPEQVQGYARRLHILCVEDNLAVRKFIDLVLSTAGHTVDLAADGREGLQKFTEGRYDVVLTDQAMPQMSGEEMIRGVKHIDPDVPIVMVTGFGDMMKSEGWMPTGVDVLLTKPFTPLELSEAVGTVIQKLDKS